MKKYSTAILCSALALYSHAENTARKGLTSSDRSSLYKAYVAAQHEFRQAADGRHYAQQPRLGWQMSFDGSGFTAKPATKDWQWGLELVDQEGWRFDPNAATSVTGNKLSIHKNTDLVEWFINDQRGLEQGWTVERRPQSYTGPLKLELKIRGDLKAQITPQNISFVDDTGKTQLTYAGLKAWDKDGRILATRFQSSGGNFCIEVEDNNAVYPITIDPLATGSYIKAFDPDAGDKFGTSIAISGTTAVIGAPQEDSNANGINRDQTNNSSLNSGAAYVFVKLNGYWDQQAYLKATNTDAGDNFGYSVSISGNTIVVGAPSESSASKGVNGNQLDNTATSAGAAYVFQRTGTLWEQQAYLKASNTGSGDAFGNSVAISENTLVVTASGEASGIVGNQNDNSAVGAGAGYVFTRTGSIWKQQAYLKADDIVQGPESGAAFGFSSAISGNTIVIGAYGDDADSGADAGTAYVFSRIGIIWGRSFLLQLPSGTGDPGDRFGHSVAISGNTIAVGATWEDSNATGFGGNLRNNSAANSGAVFLYSGSGAAWSPHAYIKASNTEPNDEFGFSVSLDGDELMVGAPFEDSSSLNLGGTQLNGTNESGAAYLFTRFDGTWTQKTYVKASNTGTGDNFGWSVALSNATLLVGALAEDSAGALADNSALDTGAAYTATFGPNLLSVSKSGTSAAGDADLAFGTPLQSAISPGAVSLFSSQLTGAGASAGKNSGVYVASAFGLGSLLLQNGSTASGLLGLPSGAKISSLLKPCANEGTINEFLFQALVAGPGINPSNNQILFRYSINGLQAVSRTGIPVSELGGATLSSFREIVQDQGGAIGISYLLKTGGLVNASNDSGLLILNPTGAVAYHEAREGVTDFGAGGNFGQFTGKAAVSAGGTYFIAKYTPTGLPSVDALFKVGFFPERSTPLSGDPAGDILSGERYGTFTGVTQRAFGALLRATLTACPLATNEGVWTDSGVLKMRKGQTVSPGITIKKIIRIWGTSADQVLAQVELTGTGVTASNNQALILRQSDAGILFLMRTGQPAPGINLNSVTVSSIQAIDVEHSSGNYVILGSLKGTAATANQALWAGNAVTGNDTTLQWARMPQLKLRKGNRYSSAAGGIYPVTPDDVIRSISLTPVADSSGVGSRGLGQTINQLGAITLTLTGDRNSKELVMLLP